MGDVLEALHAEGHLSPRQHRAFALFLCSLQAQHGTSEGIVMQLAERVQSSSKGRLRPPGGRPGHIAGLDALLHRLRPHERRLLAFMIRHRELPRGSLRDFGRQVSGYTDRIPARAVAIGRIGALLDTLADEMLAQEGAP